MDTLPDFRLSCFHGVDVVQIESHFVVLRIWVVSLEGIGGCRDGRIRPCFYCPDHKQFSL